MLSALIVATLLGAGHTTSKDRLSFAAKFARLRAGMTATQVRLALGKPDEITSESIPPGRWTSECQWRYGVIRPRGFASLGSVAFFNGKVGEIRPPIPPSKDLPDENVLRPVLQTIDDAAHQGGLQDLALYNPLFIVRADNSIIALGPRRGLEVLREYIRIRDLSYSSWEGRDFGGFAIAQTIFQIPRTGYVDAPGIGAIIPAPPKNRPDAPYWPNIVYEDVPFSAYQGAMLAGLAEPLGMYLDRLEKTSQMRTKLLTPGRDPWDVEKHLWQPLTAGSGQGQRTRNLLRCEALTLLSTAYRMELPSDSRASASSGWLDDHAWNSAAEGMRVARIRWDAHRQIYTSTDGNVIASPVLPSLFPTRYWRPAALSGIKGYLSVRRSNSQTAEVSIDWDGGLSQWKRGSVDAYSASGALLGSGPTQEEGGSFSEDANGRPDHSEVSFNVQLPVGTRLILKVQFRGKTASTPAIDVDSPVSVR